MADAIIQLPDDSSNTGKKVRTNTRSVGANSVHEHYNIIQDISGDTQARVLTVDPLPGHAGLAVRQISGDTIVGRSRIIDAQDSSLSARVYDTRALRISGDVSADGLRVQSGTYGNIQVLTTATLILNGNPSRITGIIQNVDEQQIIIGFTSAVTALNGVFIAPIGAGSSGDGGVFTVASYTGPIYGIVVSGDAACRYMEI